MDKNVVFTFCDVKITLTNKCNDFSLYTRKETMSDHGCKKHEDVNIGKIGNRMILLKTFVSVSISTCALKRYERRSDKIF